MYVFRLILLILIYSSSALGEFSSFEDEDLRFRWLSAFKINPLYSDGNEHGPIEKPAATWHPILEIYLYTKSFEIKKDCLLYYIPGNGKLGELKVVELDIDKKCTDHIFDKNLVSKKGIFNFSYELEKSTFKLLSDDDFYSYKFYSQGSGISLGNLDTLSKTSKLKNNKVCFDIDDDCRVKITNTCSKCVEGISYEIIGSACNKFYKRRCGAFECGTKGNAACIRGFKAISVDKSNYCINDSPLGFCRGELRVMCINNELICR